MSEWKKCTIGEIAFISAGGDKPSICSNKRSLDTPIPIFSNGLGNDGLYGYTNEAKIEGDTVTISARGVNVGTVCYRNEPFMPIVRLLSLIPNRQLIYARYLYYLLKNTLLSGTGSAQPQITVPMIARQEIRFHSSMDTQIKIARVLSNLDQKIALNTAINDNLEQQAQAIFKAWFVDFEPFGGIMPDDWRMGKLKEILSLKKNSIKAGTDIELPYLPIEKIPMNTFAVKEFCPNSEAKSSLITFSENDIIIGAMRVYFHRVIIAPCSGITRTTCFVLVPYDKNYLAYSLLLCNQNKSIDFAQRTSKGSTMPYAIWEGGLGDMDIIIPNYETITKFNNIIVPMLEKIKYSYFENQRLSALRDTLLPKLMNGEIDVSAVKI